MSWRCGVRACGRNTLTKGISTTASIAGLWDEVTMTRGNSPRERTLRGSPVHGTNDEDPRPATRSRRRRLTSSFIHGPGASTSRGTHELFQIYDASMRVRMRQDVKRTTPTAQILQKQSCNTTSALPSDYITNEPTQDPIENASRPTGIRHEETRSRTQQCLLLLTSPWRFRRPQRNRRAARQTRQEQRRPARESKHGDHVAVTQEGELSPLGCPSILRLAQDS